jgi:aspartate carbamoyltransferase regulatory subunit
MTCECEEKIREEYGQYRDKNKKIRCNYCEEITDCEEIAE